MPAFLTSILSADPILLFSQYALLGLGGIAVYLVIFTTRDIILRSHSFLYQAASVLIVTLLPIAGFFLYLLIRPAHTVRERELMEKVENVLPARRI